MVTSVGTESEQSAKWPLGKGAHHVTTSSSSPDDVAAPSFARSRDGRELREVLDPEALLDGVDLRDGVLEAVLAEDLVLAALEVLAEGVVLRPAHEVVQSWEEDGVLARGVGLVHADEREEQRAELASLRRILGGRGHREALHALSHLSSGLVLRPQDAHEVHELVGALEEREDHLLLLRLAIVLHERADQLGALLQGADVEVRS